MSRVFGIRVPVLKHVLNLRTLSLDWRLTRKKSDFQKYHHVNYALLNCVACMLVNAKVTYSLRKGFSLRGLYIYKMKL